MKDEISERRSFVKKRAKSIMGQRGNLLRLIGASFITLVVIDAFVYLYQTVCYFAVGGMTSVLLIIELLPIFLIASPLILALGRMAYRMCRSEQTDLSDIFYYFNKKRLLGAYAVSLGVLCERAVQIAVSMTVGGFAASVFLMPEDNYYLTLTAIFAVIVMPAVGCVFVRAFTLPTAFFMKEDMPDDFTLSTGRLRGQAKEIMLFDYSFVPLLLLSVLSLGILFVVYLLPLYLLSAQLLASYFVGCGISENYRK